MGETCSNNALFEGTGDPEEGSRQGRAGWACQGWLLTISLRTGEASTEGSGVMGSLLGSVKKCS